MTYFIDSVTGSDQNDGRSRQTAFRSIDKVNALTLQGGDAVLFKAGCTFEGNLHPKRIRDGGVIRFGRYGVGEKPLIAAPGGEAFDLCDFDYVEVRDLALTNPNGIRGLFIRNQTAGGALRHIHVTNCTIHHVNENREAYAYESGGIICASFSDEPGWFEDLLLEDNEIRSVCRSGILMTGFWANRPTKLWGKNEYKSDTENWWPSKEVVVRGNYIDETGGDGIVIIGTVGALLEWNTVYHVMTRPVPPCANAGIWPQSSNGCVMQYNEVGYCNKPEGCNDAQGFDVDLSCRDTLIQYNYSHDNGGGFLLLCELGDTTDAHGFRGTVVRNNLSVNDGGVKGELIAMVGPVRGVLIENNTLYSTGAAERIVEVWTEDGRNQAKDVVLRNNVFVSNGRDNRFNLCSGENFVFQNNLYWGTHRTPPAQESQPLVEDPQFVQGGRTGDGRQVIAAYVPQNETLAQAGAPAERPSSVDLEGRETAGKAYVGALMAAAKKE